MNDSDSYVAQIVNREPVSVRRPEKETLPKLFYKGAHQATLDPLAARRPEGGLFMWSEQQEGAGFVTSGNPNFNNSSAAALLSYDIAHSIPWDWRVSLYTWTKGIAAGVYLVSALLVVMGLLSRVSFLWLWSTPIASGAFLALTGGLLLWDLEHPKRFYLIFTRPQWRSWLVKGAFLSPHTRPYLRHTSLRVSPDWIRCNCCRPLPEFRCQWERLFTRLTCLRKRKHATFGRTRCCRRIYSFRRYC